MRGEAFVRSHSGLSSIFPLCMLSQKLGFLFQLGRLCIRSKTGGVPSFRPRSQTKVVSILVISRCLDEQLNSPQPVLKPSSPTYVPCGDFSKRVNPLLGDVFFFFFLEPTGEPFQGSHCTLGPGLQGLAAGDWSMFPVAGPPDISTTITHRCSARVPQVRFVMSMLGAPHIIKMLARMIMINVAFKVLHLTTSVPLTTLHTDLVINRGSSPCSPYSHGRVEGVHPYLCTHGSGTSIGMNSNWAT